MIAEPLRQAIEAFELEEHRERLADRERDVALGLVVMVVGEGNFGKSSLVNALCGKDVAPVAVIPKTFKIDVYKNAPEERALIRYVGDAAPNVFSHAEAQEINRKAEEAMRTGNGSTLAEIVWQHLALDLPPGVSLADTPGISQALAGAAKGLALTQVLGSTFEVDEVWAHWFHRADVVIWGFCANKMQSAETRAALEGALRLFDKRIIPVATKADFISQQRWPEIAEQFQRIYGPLLAGRQCDPLHLTVCGGPDAELRGAGVEELRATLSLISGGAKIFKQRAQERFVQDEATSVSGVLEATARELVANLRAIASLGDTLAMEAEKEAGRARKHAAVAVDSYLRSLRTSASLAAAARAVHAATQGGRQGDVEKEAKQALSRLVDQTRIQSTVDQAFTSSARSLEATAVRLAASADIGRLTFRSSGQITRHPVSLRLELRAVKLTATLPFQIRLKYPKGFLASVWDFITGLFGADRFSVDDIQDAMAGALDIDSSDFNQAKRQALCQGFAPAIRDAVNAAIQEHLKDVDARAIAKLKLVDVHLPALNSGTEQRVTTFCTQGEYWATLSPAVETLLNLAREELTRVLPDFKRLLGSISLMLLQQCTGDIRLHFLIQAGTKMPLRYPEPKNVWKGRKPDEAGVSIALAMPSALTATFYRESYIQEGTTRYRLVPFLPYLYEQQHKALQECTLVRDLDARLAECVVGARYRSAGERLAEVGSLAFKAAVAKSPRSWNTKLPARQLAGAVFAPWMFRMSVPLLLLGTIFCLLWQPTLCLGFLAAALLCAAAGFLVPYLQFWLRYRMQIPRAIEAEIKACISDTAAYIRSDTVDFVVTNMTAELAPRPLQSLMIQAGLLKGHAG